MFLSLLYQIHFPLTTFLTSAVGRCLFPLTKFLTSAVGRCLFPLAIYGEGVADWLGVRSNPYPNLKLRIVLRYHDVIKF